MPLKKIEQIKSLKNKTVLVRMDYNVAIKNNKILETERLERSFPTINFLLKKGAKLVLISHLGNPGGKKDLHFSLKPVAYYLDSIAKKQVHFVPDCVGPVVKEKVAKLKAGQILILENLRFYPGEEANDLQFAQELASLADVYVNEAFSVCHRAHASVAAITKYLPSYAGLNLADEVVNLSHLLKGFEKPSCAIIGGVKISTKIKVIENLLKRYDHVLIGGALANNFFVAQKYNIGQSIFEKDFVKVAQNLLKNAKGKLILPIDVRIAKKISTKSTVEKVSLEKLNTLKNKNFQIVDIGPKTEIYYESFIQKSKTLVWNGPLGIFEMEAFSHGTDYICQKVASHAKGSAYGAVGGGETIAVLEKLHLKKWPDFVSTAGGAMLEFLEGKILPGIKPLMRK